MFPKVPQSPLRILRVPQLHPPLEHPPSLKNPTMDVQKVEFQVAFSQFGFHSQHLGAHRFHLLNAPFFVVKSVSGSLSRHVWPGGRHDS